MPETKGPLVQQSNNVTILQLAMCSDRWGSDQIDKFRGALLDESMRIKSGQGLVVDLSGVTFFGSAFIELLLQIWNNVRHHPGTRMALCGASNYCMEIIQVTRLDSIWEIFPDQSTAIVGLQAK